MLQLYVLPIEFSFNNQHQLISPVIIRSGEELVLVDGGYAGFLPLLESAAKGHGVLLSDLTKVIITHHDIDHMGVVNELLQKYPHIKIACPATEAPYVSAQKKSLRLQQAEDLLPCMPEQYREGALEFINLLKTMQHIPVDIILPDEGDCPFLPGVSIIHTPGHMPGHISLYIEESKTLVAADAVVFGNNELDIANPQYTLDLPEAINSVKKLSLLRIYELICYHGGVLKENIPQLFQSLLSKYGHQQR